VKLIKQPGDGVSLIGKGIEKAKKSVEIVIFRLDRPEIERALVRAVERGVFVHALIAFTSRGGEKSLRKLETRFLAKGITVARTADDLVRYHGKMMLVDRKELYLLAFNFTRLDIEHSRSFGVITRNPELVQEAGKLFDCDTKRQGYSPGSPRFIVSPLNARKELAAFIRDAKKELLIYNIKISDRAMIRVLEERQKAGVRIRIIGEVAGKNTTLRACKLKRLRLHTRVIIRDRRQAFLGSQSLRQVELDARREIGIIFRDSKIVNSMAKVFESDWSESKSMGKAKSKKRSKDPVVKNAKKSAQRVANVVTNRLPVASVVATAVKQVMQQEPAMKLEHKEVTETVKDAVKEAVKDAVKKAVKNGVEEAVEQNQ
jgi:cardiolipin synthase A/B